MTNNLYVEFHTMTLTLLDNVGITALGIEQSTYDDYKAVVEAEQDFVNRTMASLYTPRMAELDSQREALMRAIIARCRHAKSAHEDNVRAAASELNALIVKPYPLASMREGVMRKSAVIGGLLIDLEKIDEDVLKALGIDTLAADLKKANGDFRQAYAARNIEYKNRGIGVMQSLREQCDELYHALVLQLSSVANRSDKALAAIGDPTEREKATAHRTLAIDMVEQLNELIKYCKAKYLKKGSASAEGEMADDPEDDDDSDTTTDGTDAPTTSGPTDVTEVTNVA